jgi:hypothetical protein
MEQNKDGQQVSRRTFLRTASTAAAAATTAVAGLPAEGE